MALFRHQDYFWLFPEIGHVMPKPETPKDNEDDDEYQNRDEAAITAGLSV
ncbi:MAG: hypothetical protein ACR2JB_11655 [Bryobacteraceae bacterium]